jgi:hypothetical protein
VRDGDSIVHGTRVLLRFCVVTKTVGYFASLFYIFLLAAFR